MILLNDEIKMLLDVYIIFIFICAFDKNTMISYR